MLPTLLLFALLQADPAVDRGTLLEGVTALEQVGVPGPVVVFGPDAFPVLTRGTGEAVVAAARFGAGRVVALGHGGYLSGGVSDEGGVLLLANAVAWAAGGARAPVVRDVRDEGALAAADVLTWAGGDLPLAAREEVRAFVHEGGGLVVGECPWGWQQLHPGLVLREDGPSNQVLAPMGIVFGPTTLGGGPFPVADSRPERAHAGEALRRLAAGAATESGVVLERALQSVPANDELFLPAVAALLAERPEFAVPSEAAPLRSGDGLARLQVAYWTRRWEDLPVDALAPAPGVEHFPGDVPASAPRETRSLELDPARPGWLSTGAYAAPGEVVTARVEQGAARGWSLRIGAHTDSIAHHDRWKRWPSVSRRFELAGPATRVASPFGGLIYLEAGRDAAALQLALEGVVAAPFFDLEHPLSEAEWQRVRAAPAPWAELAGRRLVLTVPSEAVRALAEPARLARFWDSVIAAHRRLGGRSTQAGTEPPERPERIVADVQISAGYMHSGYPIMTWLDVTRPSAGHALGLSVDVERLEREGSWGHYHELGHNSQRGDWTFAGTGEVTCNLFALHAGEVLNGIEPWENPWLARQKQKARAYLDAGARFEDWQRDPGLALLMYAQVQRAFGWEPFTAVFAEYEALSRDERPSGRGAEREQAKRDQWLVRLSRATGHDLGPFFARWGVPVSATARAEVAALSAWSPDWTELGVSD